MIAYNETWLHNLGVVKEAKQWCRHRLITQEQFAQIQEAYKSAFYHPNFLIRILLFLASLLALAGVTGMLILMIDGWSDEAVISSLALIYGVGSFVVLEMVFLKGGNHYKSGVTEALLYHSMGFTIGGIAGLTDFNEHAVIIVSILVLTFSACRYLDLVSATAAMAMLGWFIFFELYEMDGIARQIIPFAFILVFTPLYFFFRRLKRELKNDLWTDTLLIGEAISLIFVYAAGNYFVVRELSVSMMNLEIAEGGDIPFAAVFYFLTVVVPVVYLYAGIKYKDVVLLRVSLLAIAFSVFTFKYYYSLGHPEITLTAAGVVLLFVSIYLLRYLKVVQNGFTSENVLSEKWMNANAEAFIISQTLGGNKVSVEEPAKFGGGSFGGGGARGEF